jgi:flagellar biosynthetic protein FliP
MRTGEARHEFTLAPHPLPHPHIRGVRPRLPALHPDSLAQPIADPPTAPAPSADATGPDINPLEILARAGDSLPSSDKSKQGGISTALNIVVLLTVISLAPSIMLMTTCFVRIIVVCEPAPPGLGTQQLPPPQVIMGLSLCMTLLVMTPTLDRIHKEAVVPYNNGTVRDYSDLWNRARRPMKDFMLDQVEATGNYSSLYMVLNYRGIDTSHPETITRDQIDLVTLVPAYMLSELKSPSLWASASTCLSSSSTWSSPACSSR